MENESGNSVSRYENMKEMIYFLEELCLVFREFISAKNYPTKHK